MSCATRARALAATFPEPEADRIAAAVLWIVEHVTKPAAPHVPSCAGGGCLGCGECIGWYLARVGER